MLIHGLHPFVRLVFVNRSIAAGIADAVLRDEDGQTGFHSIDHGFPQGIRMGSGIKMQGIHNVFIAHNRVSRRLIHILAPVRRAYQDNAVLVILPDDRNDFLRITLHLAPGSAAVGLIADFIDYISVIRIFLRHFLEKRFGFLYVGIGIPVRKDVPVNDDIHATGRGVLHTVLHQRLQPLLVAACAVAPALRSVHGQANHVHPPVFPELPDACFVHIIRIPGQAVGADSP